MPSHSSENSSDGDHTWKPIARRSKRFKTNSGRPVRMESTAESSTPRPQEPNISLDSLLDVPFDEADFETFFPKDDYLAVRRRGLENESEDDAYGYRIRPLTTSEIHGLRGWLLGRAAADTPCWTNGDAILKRRLELHTLTLVATLTLRDRFHAQTLTAPIIPSLHVPPEETISVLNSIRRTVYECSFASRLRGNCRRPDETPHLVHRDNETRATWMELLADIRHHYGLSHPGSEPIEEDIAPVDYVPLQRSHIPQIHDLLGRIFWPGIDVSASLQCSPTQCTIVAIYRKLVVGAAFLSSPEETYLTYLVVRPGWENCGIASVMLYHLATANPRKDITLHVSANNHAMLLYNKFGFKAEEFTVGFYDDYLAKESRACKNAFFLRLRR